MKNLKFLLTPFLLIVFLLHVQSAQGQLECDASMYSITTQQNGNGVTVEVYNACPYVCYSLGFYIQRLSYLDSDPNNPVRTCADFNLAELNNGNVEYSFEENDLPPGRHSYFGVVLKNDLTGYFISSEEFTIASASNDMVWTDKVGVSQSGTRLTRNINTGGNCTSGAASVNTIPSGEDGWVEMTVTENWSSKFFGLSNSNPNPCRWTIGHSVYFQNQKLHVYEGGYIGHYANCVVGDMIRVERIGTTIYYKKNGVIFYTSHKPSSGSLIADVTITHKNGTIGDSRCSHPAVGAKITTTDTESLIVYPNPVEPDEHLNIEFNLDIDATDATLSIHNMNGQIVHEKTVGVQKGENNINVLMDDYTPGMYLLKVQAGTYNLNRKLIIK